MQGRVDEVYQQQKEVFDSALLNLQISLATLPLDILLPGAIEYGPQIAKAIRSMSGLDAMMAARFAKQVNREIEAIKKMTDPRKQADALASLLAKIKRSPNYRPTNIVEGSEDVFSIRIVDSNGRDKFIPFSPGKIDTEILENFTVIERTPGYRGGKLIEDNVVFPADPLYRDPDMNLRLGHGISWPDHNPRLGIYVDGDQFVYPGLREGNARYARLAEEFREAGLDNNIRFIDDSVIGSGSNFRDGLENFIRHMHCLDNPLVPFAGRWVAVEFSYSRYWLTLHKIISVA